MRPAPKLQLLAGCLAILCLTIACGPERPEIITDSEPTGAETSRAADATAPEGWLTDLDAAKQQAAADQKLVLVNFTGSDWCPPCIMLRRQVFSQEEFTEYAERHLVLVEVDFPRRKPQTREQALANQQLAQRYGIDGFPTIVVLNANGQVVGQLGYMPGGPGRFIAELEKLRAL